MEFIDVGVNLWQLLPGLSGHVKQDEMHNKPNPCLNIKGRTTKPYDVRELYLNNK